MSLNTLTFSCNFVNAILTASEVTKGDAEVLLKEAGIPPEVLQDAAGRVSAEQFATLYRSLAVKFDDELPNFLSQPLGGGAMKFGGLSAISAPALDVALYRYSRLLRLLIHDFEVQLLREPETGIVRFVEPESGRRCKTIGIEIMLKVVHGFASWMTARELPLVRVDFAFARPSYAADLQALFPGPVFFEQAHSQIVFEIGYLDLRIQRNAEDVATYVARLPRDWMFSPLKERLASHQVRDYLLRNEGGRISVEQVAKALHISVRTLCRRLESENTSFRQVKDEVRRALAMDRLSNSQVPLAAIAHELGFGDVSSFHRAFRAWTGITPNAYRQKAEDSNPESPS
ncbi:AraC family transcriptional regulator [Noviherbaspirillum saxi]|nr:AraC family transcriptional regulator [Noviherbaspirillum saxi]